MMIGLRVVAITPDLIFVDVYIDNVIKQIFLIRRSDYEVLK